MVVADTVAVLASVAEVGTAATMEGASIVGFRAFAIVAASVAFVGYRAVELRFTRFGTWHVQDQNSLEGIVTTTTAEGVVAATSMEQVAGIVTAA